MASVSSLDRRLPAPPRAGRSPAVRRTVGLLGSLEQHERQHRGQRGVGEKLGEPRVSSSLSHLQAARLLPPLPQPCPHGARLRQHRSEALSVAVPNPANWGNAPTGTYSKTFRPATAPPVPVPSWTTMPSGIVSRFSLFGSGVRIGNVRAISTDMPSASGSNAGSSFCFSCWRSRHFRFRSAPVVGLSPRSGLPISRSK
jgi:hypothetical protein